MLKRIQKVAKISLIILLNLIEAFFLVSSIFLLFPFIKYLIGGKDDVLELFTETQYQVIAEFFTRFNFEINLINLIVLAILPVIIGQTIVFIKTVNIVEIQQQLIFDLRSIFVYKLMNTEINVLKSSKVGELSNSIAMECQRVGLSIQYIINFYSFAFISFVYLIILFGISKELVLVTVAGISIIPFMVKKQNKDLKDLGKVVASSNESIQNFIIEKIRILKKILLLNKQQEEINEFLQISKVFEDTYLRSGRIAALIEAFLEPFVFIMAMFIVYIGVEIFNIKFDIIIIFLFVLSKLSRAIKGVIMSKNQINIYAGSFELYDKYLILLSNNQTEDKSGLIEFYILQDLITLKNVGFSFGKTKLFDGLNLTINANETVAFVGKSGAGKSTLIDLLLGFILIEDGAVLFDDHNIDDIDIKTLRNKIGLVTQDCYLINGSIKDNLLYGLGEKTDLEVKDACQKAHILEFIESLPDKFHYQIGESGGKLSGGQKQRLQLAHLFLQDPEIIIMDEPTSALDSESEKAIVNTLKELHGKKTIIIVAHRLSTIQHADKIIVLEDGKVIEEGSHQKLLTNNNRYKKYFNGNEY